MKLPSATLAHVGVAVRDLDEALTFYRDVLGLVPRPPETQDGSTIVALSMGEVDIELLCPITTNGPVAKFLDRRGPGIHHLCLRVPDLSAALEACRAHGYRLVDKTPREGHDGRPIAFVHPKATNGILIELTE